MRKNRAVAKKAGRSAKVQYAPEPKSMVSWGGESNTMFVENSGDGIGQTVSYIIELFRTGKPKRNVFGERYTPIYTVSKTKVVAIGDTMSSRMAMVEDMAHRLLDDEVDRRDNLLLSRQKLAAKQGKKIPRHPGWRYNLGVSIYREVASW